MADHAIVSPSAAERWFNCPPSARVEARLPERSSDYADEGSLGHSLGALKLNWHLGSTTSEQYAENMEVIKANKYYSAELRGCIDGYVDYCVEIFKTAELRDKNAECFIETKFKLTAYIEEGFGTMDFSCVYSNTLHVVDLKMGGGIYVNAEKNKQLMIYALGMYEKFKRSHDITKVLMSIYQPRMDNINTFVLDLNELLLWGNGVLKPAATKAFAGEGDFKAGDHCRFCSAKAKCRTLAKHYDELAKLEFKDPQLLSDDELAKVVLLAPRVKNWAEAVEKYALELAIKSDKLLPGTKLVAGGKGKRTFINKAEVLTKLKKMGVNESYYLTLDALTNIEKKLGKLIFDENFASFITRPEGRPKLVDVSDERPDFDRNKAAAIEFADIDLDNP